jgi:hypothetical protein
VKARGKANKGFPVSWLARKMRQTSNPTVSPTADLSFKTLK